jgi:hypothetical protein
MEVLLKLQYCVPSGCGKVYVGQTGRAIETRYIEHMSYIHLGQTEKSAVAEHNLETRCSINFISTSILDKATVYMDYVIKEATEISSTLEALTVMEVSLSASTGIWQLTWSSNIEIHLCREKPK